MIATDLQAVIASLSVPARRRLAGSARLARSVGRMLGSAPPVVFAGRRSLLAALCVDESENEVLLLTLRDAGLTVAVDLDELVAVCGRAPAVRRLAAAAMAAPRERAPEIAATLLRSIAEIATRVGQIADGDTLYVIIDDTDDAIAVVTVVETLQLEPAQGGAA